LRIINLKRRKKLAFLPIVQIRAGLGRSYIKLRRKGKRVSHLLKCSKAIGPMQLESMALKIL